MDCLMFQMIYMIELTNILFSVDTGIKNLPKLDLSPFERNIRWRVRSQQEYVSFEGKVFPEFGWILP